jgi:hypothetical protein
MLIINTLVHFFIYSFFIFSIYGYGLAFNKFIFKYDSNYGEKGLYGFILIYFIVFVLHFIIPINIVLSFSLLILGTLYYLKKILFSQKKISFSKEVLIIFLLSYISSLTVNLHDDVRSYQLPYINLVQDFRIIFGLVNINDFYVYSHGLYDIMAFFKIPYYENRFIFLIPVIFIFFFICSIYDILKKSKSNIVSTYIFLILSLFLLKFYRSKEFGTDLPVTSVIFLCQIYFLKIFDEFDKVFFAKLVIFSLFAFFLKVYSFLLIFLIFYFYSNYQKIYSFFKSNYILTIFLIFFSVISFSKSFILSGCFVYPEPKTCVSSKIVKWSYDKDLTKYRKDFLAAGSKGWRQYLRLNDFDNLISAKDYLEYNKIKYLYYVFHDNDRERVLLPVLLTLLFFLIAFFFYKIKTVKFIIPNKLLYYSGITFVCWLYLFPISKYGGYAYVLFFSYLFLLKIFNNFEFNQKFFSSILIMLTFFFGYKNLNRIYEEVIPIKKHQIDPNFNNNDFPIPIFKDIKFKSIIIDNVNVNITNDEYECSNIKPICIPLLAENLVSFEKKNDYLFVYGDKNKLINYQQRWTDKTHYLID